jgi:hypothetical protein
MNQLKADLAQAQAKVQELLTKENEQAAKNPKTGKAEAPTAKKPVAPAKKK